ERPVLAGERDEDVAGGGDQDVPRVPHAGRDDDGEVPVGPCRIVARHETDDRAAPLGRPARGRLHDPSQATAHEHRTGGGDLRTDRLRQPLRSAAASPATGDRDLDGTPGAPRRTHGSTSRGPSSARLRSRKRGGSAVSGTPRPGAPTRAASRPAARAPSTSSAKVSPTNSTSSGARPRSERPARTSAGWGLRSPSASETTTPSR